jgi:hypothetical protein
VAGKGQSGGRKKSRKGCESAPSLLSSTYRTRVSQEYRVARNCGEHRSVQSYRERKRMRRTKEARTARRMSLPCGGGVVLGVNKMRKAANLSKEGSAGKL